MELILLGGRNLDQQYWIREVENNLSLGFAATHVLDYGHWKRGVVEEDVVEEAENLAALVDSLQGEYAIFGKSMGSLVTAEAIKQGWIHSSFCLFAGTPIKSPLAHEDNRTRRIEYLFRGYQTPTLFLQNLDEKFMKPDALEKTLESLGVQNFEVAPFSGKGHSYSARHLRDVMLYLALSSVHKTGIFYDKRDMH